MVQRFPPSTVLRVEGLSFGLFGLKLGNLGTQDDIHIYNSTVDGGNLAPLEVLEASSSGPLGGARFHPSTA